MGFHVLRGQARGVHVLRGQVRGVHVLKGQVVEMVKCMVGEDTAGSQCFI